MKKINEIIDAVKLLQEYNKDHHERIHELEKLARIAESSLAQKSEQIKVLQKKLVDFDHVTDNGKKVDVVCKCGRDDVCTCGAKVAIVEEDMLVPDEVEFYTDPYYNIGMKFGRQILFLPNPEYVSNSVWQVILFSENERDLLKCKLVPCNIEDVKIGEWVYANYELCLDEQDKYYLCIGDKLFCYIDEGVKEIAWGAMTNNLNVHYLYKVQPIE